MRRVCNDNKSDFLTDGYFVVRNFLDGEETAIVAEAMRSDPMLSRYRFEPKDSKGQGTGIVVWNQPGDSSYGLLARSEPLVDAMQALLGGEVYHYHSKLTAKSPGSGGAWEWHQDYDYWREFGCPEPLMASAMIAIDDADKRNGCLQVIPGSHRLGLLPHQEIGTQRAATPDAVKRASAAREPVYCEVSAGDLIVFHCNTLHRSDANSSSRDRWTLLCCFNAARNAPRKAQMHSGYRQLQKVSSDAIRECGVRLANGREEEFLDMKT